MNLVSNCSPRAARTIGVLSRGSGVPLSSSGTSSALQAALDRGALVTAEIQPSALPDVGQQGPKLLFVLSQLGYVCAADDALQQRPKLIQLGNYIDGGRRE
jgi:hypothetical protein